ncbi:short chain dehydrogenase [Microdochium trichocladiopsis]|uniref:Short chain dehydrogenase n=1 Tax=Microdochium trichocladiopsis TaxID=1682393 RepID=A0A9P9BJ95_9PEZI|nr:short chain dehydrogenase [Microdochium trichocladiopsis]KAH7025013.1 short chain dehydrogenase [Microdochium trichocladiopsis]
MTPSPKRTVLITGCSAGGIGDYLAQAFHARGDCRVFATARNPSKMSHLAALGIETLALDVTSAESIASCVGKVAAETNGRGLDVLVNNAGNGSPGPLMETDMEAARHVMELNFWAVLETTRGFLPLLIKSGRGVIVNNTSAGSSILLLWAGVYSLAKAATAMMCEVLRLELEPLGVQVVDIKTGGVKTNFHSNQLGDSRDPTLVPGSLYETARKEIEAHMGGKELREGAVEVDVYATKVVADLLGGKRAPRFVWQGAGSRLLWMSLTFFPSSVMDMLVRQVSKLDVIEKVMKDARRVGGKP